ncbi:hypothetical protein QO010_001623 [Caulobacter ginsengisoli]|uniref:Bacterial Ig domain-containing protein n=1 Tax=Caulobacter ginsengisoli TaxID=400775 RepID=A0ABU0IPC3_9CAUL|nr:hypothetical protein [Caulobacter ginsengisoli]MDQ0463852.1 hypothetical protein [Caulobacter ginsengisoli]
MSIRTILPALLLLACAGCGGPSATDPARDPARSNVAAYLKPAGVLTAQAGRDGAFRIEGVALPGSRVQLSPVGGGGVVSAVADAEGHWSLVAPPAAGVRLFLVQMTHGQRTVVGEGMLMLAPDGRSAELRPSSASKVLAPVTASPRIFSVDFDGGGGAVIGGVATAGSGMNIRVDHRASGNVTVDAQGRFVAAIGRLSEGSHLIDVSGEAGQDQIVISASRAAPLAGGQFRATRLDRAWRIDWMTPAGGLQSSIVVARVETGA